MKYLFAGIVFATFATTAFAAEMNGPAVIPRPQKMQVAPGDFLFTKNTKILASFDSLQTAKQLAVLLHNSTGYSFNTGLEIESNDIISNDIILTTKSANTNLGTEGYDLIIHTNSIIICAPTQAGLFYGTQTLLQLLPPQIFSSNAVSNLDWRVPCVHIEDWPRFQWRGLMIDVSRHFFSKNEIKKILDEMALYKLNTFHWHLVDDQGWRIEIKKYPKLTQIGAWRKQSELAHSPSADEQTNARPTWTGAPASDYGADKRYGGFYTQNDIREIVAYAAARHITVIPEIEMPGHSVAVLAAYPQFSCFGGPYNTDIGAGVQEGIYDPANPETFKFLGNVLMEVFQLFPSKYIHIGGDEVRKDYWARSSDCQVLMKREGLKNEEDLQGWFIRRMEKFVNAHGKTMIGWSEILQGGLATNAAVMDWIGGGKEAASMGHDVVMTPTSYCYLNYYQSKDRSTEPHAQNGYIPLYKIYSFEPIPKGLAPQFDSHILGAEACLWTEWIASLPHAEYMLFPRLCALAEVVWSPKNLRDWDDFQRRLTVNEQRLNELGVNYHRTIIKIKKSEPD